MHPERRRHREPSRPPRWHRSRSARSGARRTWWRSGTGGAARRTGQRSHHARRDRGTADVPATELRPARPQRARPGEAAIPGLLKRAHQHHPGDATALPPYHRHDVPPGDTPVPGTSVQQAFIQQVARGAMATQRKYGVPASVTIAQAIDESGWGQSVLATNDHNLFGIKGTGPAGSDVQPTQEVINGQLVNLSASFQIYQNVAQSIDAHGRLLARSGDYATAMSRRADPNAFAAALTGIYATDPEYGAKLIQLMEHYGLYRFDRPAARGDASGSAHGGAAHGHGGGRPSAPQHPGPDAGHQASRPGQAHHPGSQPHPAHSALPQPSPDPRSTSPGHDRTPTPQDPGPIGNPVPVQPGPMAWPPPAHDATPAQGGQTGAGLTVHQKGAPQAGLAADQAHAAHYDPAAHPAATPYPGRSARPAPLAHPARPTGLARTSGPAPLPDTGHRADSAASSSSAQPDGRHGQPTGHTSQGSGSGPGLANMSADAAIPGVPHEAAPQAGHWHPGRAGGRLRPAHPAMRSPAVHPAVGPARPAARADLGRPTARGTARGTVAGAQQATAPTAQPQHASTNPAGTPHVTLPAAAAPVAGQTGGAVIPGLQHPGPRRARSGRNVWERNGRSGSRCGGHGPSPAEAASRACSRVLRLDLRAKPVCQPAPRPHRTRQHPAARWRRTAAPRHREPGRQPAPRGDPAQGRQLATQRRHPAARRRHRAKRPPRRRPAARSGTAPPRRRQPARTRSTPGRQPTGGGTRRRAAPSHAPRGGAPRGLRGTQPRVGRTGGASARAAPRRRRPYRPQLLRLQARRPRGPRPAAANPLPSAASVADAGRRGRSRSGPQHGRHRTDRPGRLQRELSRQRRPGRQLFPGRRLFPGRQFPGKPPIPRGQHHRHADRLPRSHAAIGPTGIPHLGQDAVGPRRTALPRRGKPHRHPLGDPGGM